MTPQERYAAMVGELIHRPDAAAGSNEPGPRKRFGSSGLKVRGRIFAMLMAGGLVAKLPRRRVDALVGAGVGEPYDPRRDGCLMKEWLTVGPAFDDRRLALAAEALEFVGSKG